MKIPLARATALGVTWHRSSECSNSNCVELARLDDELVAVRDSKNPEQAALVFSRDEMAAFVKGVKAGEFDDLC